MGITSGMIVDQGKWERLWVRVKKSRGTNFSKWWTGTHDIFSQYHGLAIFASSAGHNLVTKVANRGTSLLKEDTGMMTTEATQVCLASFTQCKRGQMHKFGKHLACLQFPGVHTSCPWRHSSAWPSFSAHKKMLHCRKNRKLFRNPKHHVFSGNYTLHQYLNQEHTNYSSKQKHTRFHKSRWICNICSPGSSQTEPQIQIQFHVSFWLLDMIIYALQWNVYCTTNDHACGPNQQTKSILSFRKLLLTQVEDGIVFPKLMLSLLKQRRKPHTDLQRGSGMENKNDKQ